MLKRSQQFIRLAHINFVLVRHGLDQVFLNIPWLYPIRSLAYLNPWNWRSNKNRSHGERIRTVLEELGPIFIKFGQVLSTRRDLLPEDIADELAKLQDNVPPFASAEARKIVEQAYNDSLENIFAEFNLTPLASASIAQVHTATLHNGKHAIVKILRPNIKKIIKRDVSLLWTVAKLLDRYWDGAKRLHPLEIIAEFERTILDELDLMREAGNASQLRRNFINSDLLYIPEIYWPYARKTVLVMERIEGIRISNIKQLDALGINLKKLAERGVEIFFTQVFRDCFFHADMHPGNIFVSTKNLDDPQYIAVDFGIIGTLNPTDQRYLAENFLAFFKRDYRRVAELHVESGWVDPKTRVNDLESAIRTVCEPIFEKPLKDISCGKLLLRLFQTAKRFKMEVQPQLLLLQKTLLNIEGLGRQLYPDLDLWHTAKPFLEEWIKKQVGPRAFIKKLKTSWPALMDNLPNSPELIYKTLENANRFYANNKSLNLQPAPQPKPKKSIRGFLLGAGVVGLFIGAIQYVAPNLKLFTSSHTLAWLVAGIVLVGLSCLIN